MEVVIKYYRLFNLLSIDVAAGAVVCALFFAKLFETTAATPSLISLGLTVWLIYTADRLLDVRDAKGDVSSERHRFHKDHHRKLFISFFVIIVIDLAVTLLLPDLIIKRGIFLSVIVIIYVQLRRRLRYFKEFFVALLYTIGVVIPALPSSIRPVGAFWPLGLFFLIALLNLILFSWYERDNDVKDKQPSIATMLSEPIIRFIFMSLFVISLSILGYMILQLEMYFVSMIMFAMIGILGLLFWRRDLFDRFDFYRWMGDAIFLLPAVYLLFNEQ